jgi:hypothetical protein
MAGDPSPAFLSHSATLEPTLGSESATLAPQKVRFTPPFGVEISQNGNPRRVFWPSRASLPVKRNLTFFSCLPFRLVCGSIQLVILNARQAARIFLLPSFDETANCFPDSGYRGRPINPVDKLQQDIIIAHELQ